MINTSPEPLSDSLSSIRLYETFVAKGFTKEEAKEVISDFVELTKKTGQTIENKFDTKLDLITSKIETLDSKFTEKFESLDSKFTEKFESLDSKFKLGFSWTIGLIVAMFATILSTVLALAFK